MKKHIRRQTENVGASQLHVVEVSPSAHGVNLQKFVEATVTLTRNWVDLTAFRKRAWAMRPAHKLAAEWA